MKIEQIGALPVARLAAPDAALVLLAVAPMLDQALATMIAWGFKFKTAGAWAKQSRTNGHWAFGTGYLLRSAAEFYLIGTRGNPTRSARDVRNLVVAPVREHSRKPDRLYDDLARAIRQRAKVRAVRSRASTRMGVLGRRGGAVPMTDCPRCDELREQVRRLEVALFGERDAIPGEWRLTRMQGRLFCALLRAPVLTKERAFSALYYDRADGDDPGSRMVDIFVCKLRRKLGPHGVAIETVWGVGYSLDEAARARFRPAMLTPTEHRPIAGT